MNSTKQKLAQNNGLDAGANLLDSLVPDIKVPIMEPSKGVWFKNWIKNAKCKMREASENIKRKNMQIAHWILNTKIMKSALPDKTKDMITLVMRSKYLNKPINYNYSKEKLNVKRITAFKNNAIIYRMRILDTVDPLNQMILLNERKTFLLNKRLILLKGIKCNETLEVKFEKLGSEGRKIEKSFLSHQDLKL